MTKYVVGTAVAVLGILGVLYFVYPEAISSMWAMFRASWIVIIPALIALAVAFFLATNETYGWATLAGIFGIGWLIVGGTFIHFQQESKMADSLVVEKTSPNELDFRDRAPFDVATATSSRTLGDTTGDATGSLKAIPTAGKNGEYTTSVVRRGFAKGYESTQTLTPPLFGASTSKDVRFCEFDEDNELRFGGALFNNNLKRAIIHKTGPGIQVDQDDAFVVCDKKTPIVYAPVTTQKGFAVTNRVPAGVVTYNGKTGELNYEKNYKGTLPVYPNTVATQQRESLTASGSFFDWVFNRAGWETTEADANDPNGVNRADFSMSNPDGTTHHYVTPLTPRGDSTSIVALSTVDGSNMKNKTLNPIQVYKYESGESRQANSSIAARITGDVLGGYKAQGLSVFEIVPSSDGNWVASIGKDQSILYRALIKEDGTITLSDKAEDAQGDSKPKADAKVKLDKPIEEMDEEELKDLGNQILDELAKRSVD